jgi:hypothetical protein
MTILLIGLILLFPEALISKLRKAVLIAAPFVLFPKSGGVFEAGLLIQS